MNELNKNTLKNAFTKLPSYRPDDRLWESLSSKLDNELRLADALQELPNYQAPESTWKQIRGRLDRHQFTRFYLSRAAAIAIILVAAGALFLRSRQQQPLVAVTYAMENIHIPELTDPYYQADEALIADLMEDIESTSFLSTDPGIIELKTEYEELREANELLRSLITQYGADPSLEQQLKDIEFQRSNLVKTISHQLIVFN